MAYVCCYFYLHKDLIYCLIYKLQPSIIVKWIIDCIIFVRSDKYNAVSWFAVSFAIRCYVPLKVYNANRLHYVNTFGATDRLLRCVSQVQFPNKYLYGVKIIIPGLAVCVKY